MKKYLFSALALGMMLTSCQSEEPKPGQPGSNEEVAFTISLPDVMGTRATDHTSWTNSALGGATNNVGKDVTFTFTNNVITNSAEHPSRNWFEFKTSAGTKVIEGNTKDGAAWTPGDAEGLK